MFASFLNGISISVICVFSMIFVFNAKFDRLLAKQIKLIKQKIGENRRSLTRVPCFVSWNTLAFNFYRSLYCARKNESILYFRTIYKANRNYTSMLGKSTHLAVIPQQSTQNTANLPLQTYEKNHWTCFITPHGRRFELSQ